MKTSVVIQNALRAATLPHVGPYQEIGKAFSRLPAAVDGSHLLGPSAVMVAIYYDNPATTPAAMLRSDAGIVVGPGLELPVSVTDTLIDGGRYLHVRHVGAYSGLPAAWAHLRVQGLAEHGVERGAGPSYELYPNNPGNAATSELVTDIYVPVR
jgi:AraC family transcriptional regulator